MLSEVSGFVGSCGVFETILFVGLAYAAGCDEEEIQNGIECLMTHDLL
jgi:hypothetical protein